MREKSGHQAAAAELAHRGLPLGRGLRRAAALRPIIIPPRPGTAALRSPGNVRREDALTCSSVADARAYLAQPPRLQPSAPATTAASLAPREAANHEGRDLCKSILGGKAEPGRLCSEAYRRRSELNRGQAAVDVALQSQVTRPPFQFPIGSFPQILCLALRISPIRLENKLARDCSVV